MGVTQWMLMTVLAVVLAVQLTSVDAADDLAMLSKPVLDFKAKDFQVQVKDYIHAWVFVYHTEEAAKADGVADSVKALAKSLHGFARVAHVKVDTDEGKAILKEQGIDTPPNYRVYAYTVEAKSDPKDVETSEAAIEAVRAGTPRELVSHITSPEAVQGFLGVSIQAGKIPALLFIEKDEVPDLMIKLSLWMSDSFTFAVYSKPAQDVLQQMQIAKLPQLQLMVPQPVEGDEGAVSFGASPYDRKMFGAMKFNNLLRFFAAAQMELRKAGLIREPDEAPAERSANVETRPTFELTPELAPKVCKSGSMGLCIIAFLDGSSFNTDREAQIQALEAVRTSSLFKGRHLTFAWVDLPCHPSYAQALDINIDAAPAVIAYSPSKGRFAKMLSGFNEKSISTFVSSVLGGQVRIVPLPGKDVVALPSMPESEDCEAFHAANAVVAEDEIELDDIMSELLEDRAEEERAAQDAAKETDTQVEDDEMAAKRRIAEEELAKLNGPTKRTKKKRRRKKRRGKKKKDEL